MGPGLRLGATILRRTATTTTKEIMHAGAACIGQGQSLADAARMMRDRDVGALPICGGDDRLHGIITDLRRR